MGALTHKEREGLQEVFLSIQSQNKHNYAKKIKLSLKKIFIIKLKMTYKKSHKRG